MKVGDMELSSSEGIQFGVPERSGEAVKTSTHEVESLPEISRPLAWFGVGLSSLGVLTLLLAAFLLSSSLILIPLPGLLLLLCGSLYFATRKEKHREGESLDLSEVATQRRLRLFLHLQEQGPLTIEALQEELQWTQEALFSALQGLLQQERIREDLDLETGHWIYELVDEPMTLDFHDPKALPLEERIKALPVQVSESP